MPDKYLNGTVREVLFSTKTWTGHRARHASHNVPFRWLRSSRWIVLHASDSSLCCDTQTCTSKELNNTVQIAVFYTDTCACCRISLHILNVLLRPASNELRNTFPIVHFSTLKTAHVSDSPLFYPQNCTCTELNNTFQKSSLSSTLTLVLSVELCFTYWVYNPDMGLMNWAIVSDSPLFHSQICTFTELNNTLQIAVLYTDAGCQLPTALHILNVPFRPMPNEQSNTFHIVRSNTLKPVSPMNWTTRFR